MEERIVRLRQCREVNPDASLAVAAKAAQRHNPLMERASALWPAARDKARGTVASVKNAKPLLAAGLCGIAGTMATIDISVFNSSGMGNKILGMTPLIFGLSASTYKFAKKQQLKDIQKQNDLETLRSSPLPAEVQYALASRGGFDQKVAMLQNPCTSPKTIGMIRKSKAFKEQLLGSREEATMAIGHYEQRLRDDPKNPFLCAQLRRVTMDLEMYSEAIDVLYSRHIPAPLALGTDPAVAAA